MSSATGGTRSPDLRATAHLRWPGGEHDWAWIGGVDADAVERIGSINWIVPDAVGAISLDLVLTHQGEELADNHYQGTISPDRLSRTHALRSLRRCGVGSR